MYNNAILHLMWIASAVFLPYAATSHVNLDYPSLLEHGRSACPEESLVFTCEVYEAKTLVWTSDEYIGSGLELDFNIHDDVGKLNTSYIDPDSNYANLTYNNYNNSLQSELHIRSNLSSQVSCKTANGGSKQSFDLNVLGNDPPEMPQDPAAVEIPSTLAPCVILIKWSPPNNIDKLDIDYYVVRTSSQGKIDSVNETSTLAIFFSPCTDLENLNINITAVDRCEREGTSTANFKPSILPSVSTTTVSPISVITTSSPIPFAEYSMILAAVSGAISLAVLIGVCCLCILCVCFYRKFRKVSEKESGNVQGVSISPNPEGPEAHSSEQAPLNGSGSSSRSYGSTSPKSESTKKEESS